MRMSRTAIPAFMNESGNYNDRLEEREGDCFKNSGSSREVVVAGSMSILREGKSIGDLHFLPQRGGSIAHCASTVHEVWQAGQSARTGILLRLYACTSLVRQRRERLGSQTSCQYIYLSVQVS